MLANQQPSPQDSQLMPEAPTGRGDLLFLGKCPPPLPLGLPPFHCQPHQVPPLIYMGRWHSEGKFTQVMNFFLTIPILNYFTCFFLLASLGLDFYFLKHTWKITLKLCYFSCLVFLDFQTHFICRLVYVFSVCIMAISFHFYFLTFFFILGYF